MIIKEKPNFFGHIFSFYLLAQFKETRAYPLIAKIFSHTSEDVDLIAGDFVTEGLNRVLASVCDGNLIPLKRLIENKHVYEYVRGAALEALVILVVHGLKTRDEILDYYRSLFRGKLEREESHAWNALVGCCCDLHLEELYDEIKWAYDEDLIDLDFIKLRDVRNNFQKNKEQHFEELKNDSHNKLIDDTIECMEWWAYFQPEKKSKPIKKEAPKLLSKVTNTQFKPWSSKKIGRNQPCPCGSGKKYKKCCGSISTNKLNPQVRFSNF